MSKKQKRVFAYSNLPARPGNVLTQAIAVGLLMDRLNAPGWVWGAVGLFYALIFIVAIVASFTQVQIDYFNNEK
jgi:hypothetical protein